MKTGLFWILFIGLKLMCIPSLSAQTIQFIESGSDSDSSYYDIARVSQGEYWIGGEYGILKRVNDKGEISTIVYPSTGVHILRIQSIGNQVIALGDKGTIYVHNQETREWKVFQFTLFNKRCFYDVQHMQDGKLLICGGKSGIARGKRVIPDGFIALYDLATPEKDPQIIWKNKRKFVWTFAKNAQGEVKAAIFNGLNSRIYSSSDGLNWEKQTKVKGLVHALMAVEDTMYYSGCKSIRYDKKGIWGRVGDHKKHNEITNSGFICSMVEVNGNIYGFSQQGQFLNLKQGGSHPVFQSDSKFAMYEAVITDEGRIYLVGHGKGIIFIELN